MSQIIYAEDDAIVAEIVSKTLTSEGHDVDIIDDGLLALKTIKSKKPDLVILDCTIPGMPGIEVLRSLRAEQCFYHLPIIMLTARQGKSDVSLATYAGADGYVKKPLDPEYLAFVIECLLNDGRTAGNI